MDCYLSYTKQDDTCWGHCLLDYYSGREMADLQAINIYAWREGRNLSESCIQDVYDRVADPEQNFGKDRIRIFRKVGSGLNQSYIKK